MIKVSIIIPVYRSMKYLAECLNSVLRQELQKMEIICIDDASDDDCAVILDEYASKDQRIKVIHLPENRGQEHARNLGLKEACGKYVYFLDSDDEIAESALKELYDYAENEQLDGIFFDSRAVAENETLAKRNRFYLEKRTGVYPDCATSGRELFSCLVQNNEWAVYVQRQFWRRDYLLQSDICFPEGIIHGDELFSAAAILKAERVRYIPKQYAVYCFRSNSITNTKSPYQDVVGYFTDYCKLTAILAEIPYLREAAFNAAHLRDLTVRYYNKLSKEEQRRNLFANQPLEREYAFFLGELETLQAENEVYREKFSSIHEYASVVVYGAGTIAELFTRRLLASGKSIDRYVVSEGQYHPESFCNRLVFNYHELDMKENETIVIAMNAEQASKVSEQLLRDKIDHFIYNGRTLCQIQTRKQ